jgi:hypothetical protein
MTITAHLPIPYEWVKELKAIAESKDPLKKWTAEGREIIRGYLDMRAANAELMEKAAQAEAN